MKQISEAVLIAYLRERAAFWSTFPAHADAAKLLSKELDLLSAEWVRGKLEARDCKNN